MILNSVIYWLTGEPGSGLGEWAAAQKWAEWAAAKKWAEKWWEWAYLKVFSKWFGSNPPDPKCEIRAGTVKKHVKSVKDTPELQASRYVFFAKCYGFLAK